MTLEQHRVLAMIGIAAQGHSRKLPRPEGMSNWRLGAGLTVGAYAPYFFSKKKSMHECQEPDLCGLDATLMRSESPVLRSPVLLTTVCVMCVNTANC
jgi:hypothetical protein